MKKTMALLAACLLLPVSSFAAAGEGNAPAPVPPQSHARLVQKEFFVAESAGRQFYFNAPGLDLAVYEPSTGHVWSNVIDQTLYTEEVANATRLETFLDVTTANKDTQTNTAVYDCAKNQSSVAVGHEAIKNGVLLHFQFKKLFISFDVRMTFEEGRLTVSVPGDSLKEEGKEKLLSIQLLPMLASGRADQDGYLFFPDGSGSLVHFKPGSGAAFPLMLPFYGQSRADFAEEESRREQGVENLVCPVFGVKADDTAVFANVVSGAAEATLTVAPGGYLFNNLYREYVTFHVRRQYSYTDSNKNEQTYTDPGPIVTDRAVAYDFLSGDDADYSGMAGVYRAWLTKVYGLKKREVTGDIPLSLDLFMGIRKKGFLFYNMVKMTTYDEAGGIIRDLKSKGVGAMDVELVGWAKNGYDAYPTAPKPESSLGGSAGLKKLMALCEEEGVELSLRTELLRANKAAGDYNRRSDVIRDYPGYVVEDKDSDFALIHPTAFRQTILPKWLHSLLRFPKTSFSMGSVGNSLFYSFSRSEYITREKALQDIEAGLKEMLESREEGRRLIVTGGNIYAAVQADKLVAVPDGHTNYMLADESVPFYQMALHGLIPYTTGTGNSSYDLDNQVLRWAELGAQPYFELTGASPDKLKGTTYTTLFNSEYRLWADRVAEIYKDYNHNLRGLQDKVMLRHERLTNDVVCVTYEGGARVFVNYGSTDWSDGGVTVPARDFTVNGV